MSLFHLEIHWAEAMLRDHGPVGYQTSDPEVMEMVEKTLDHTTRALRKTHRTCYRPPLLPIPTTPSILPVLLALPSQTSMAAVTLVFLSNSHRFVLSMIRAHRALIGGGTDIFVLMYNTC